MKGANIKSIFLIALFGVTAIFVGCNKKKNNVSSLSSLTSLSSDSKNSNNETLSTNSNSIISSNHDHSYGENNYSWNIDKCLAWTSCEICGYKISEEVECEYIKDTDATCTNDELGHLVANFTNKRFESKVSEKNSFIKEDTKLPHKYGERTYVWNNRDCVASTTCKECQFVLTETAEGIYFVDNEATCINNELGHLVGSFINEEFEEQVTPINSYEMDGTILSHNYGNAFYWWEYDKLDSNTIIAHASIECDSCQHKEEEQETIEEFDYEVEPTCYRNGIGSYLAVFENDLLGSKTFEIEIEANIPHALSTPEYVWTHGEEDVLHAYAYCTNDGCQYSISEDATKKLFIDVSTTCTQDGLGHYETIFVEHGNIFDSIIEPTESYVYQVAQGHNFDKVEIIDNNDGTVTFKGLCIEEGKEYSQTIQTIYIVDSEATHSSNEKGHYEALGFGDFNGYNYASETHEIPNTILSE